MALPDRSRRYRGPRLSLFLWVALAELVPASLWVFSGDFALEPGHWVLVAALVALVAILVWALVRTDLVIGPAGVTRFFWGLWRRWPWRRIEKLVEYRATGPDGVTHVYYDVHGGGRRLFRFTSSLEGAEEAAETIRAALATREERAGA